jgi:uncharacterized protein (DUF2336 family)
MSVRQAVLAELEDSIAQGNSRKRLDTLRRMTDLFMLGAKGYSAEQIELFDEVIGRLAVAIEARWRAELGNRLASVPNAPVRVVKDLAGDDIIDVAAPVLSQSPRLEDETLILIATSKGQEHLLAICARQSISEALADVLLTRGNQQVARLLAKNRGARMSESGFGTLVRRSTRDEALALDVGLRADLPSHHLTKLIEDASEAVRRKLAAANRVATAEVRRVASLAASTAKAEPAVPRRDYTTAKRRVSEHRKGAKLGDGEVRSFAQAGQYEETVVALSQLCRLPIEAIETALQDEGSDMCLVVARAAGLSWSTAKLILLMRRRAAAPPHRISSAPRTPSRSCSRRSPNGWPASTRPGKAPIRSANRLRPAVLPGTARPRPPAPPPPLPTWRGRRGRTCRPASR